MNPVDLVTSCKRFYYQTLIPEYELDSSLFRMEQGKLTLNQYNKQTVEKSNRYCKFSFNCKGDEGRKKADRKIFTNAFSNYQYQYNFSISDLKKSETINGFSLSSAIGIYIIAAKDEVIYVGDTNRSLFVRLKEFIEGLNFGSGHAGSNKICWIKNEEYLTGLMSKSKEFVNHNESMANFFNDVKTSRWYSDASFKKKIFEAKALDVFFLMFYKPENSYDLQRRRIISLLESHAILTCIKSDGVNALPLIFD